MALKSCLSCVIPALVCLAFGSAHAAEDAAPQPATQAEPATEQATQPDPKPKEEAAGKKAPEGSSTKEEPECNN